MSDNNKSAAEICRFLTPTTLYIAGPTKSGKTSLARRMAQQTDYLFGPSRKVVWCYAKGTEQKEVFESLGNKVELIEGFPRELIEKGKLFKREDNGILFLDDLYTELINDKLFVQMIVQLSHHQNYSIVYMAQTLFDPQNKYSSILLRNFDILVLFRNPRDVLSINILGQRAFRIKNAKFLMACYKLACQEPYTSLIIDYRQQVPDWLMVRQGCLKDEDVYAFEAEEEPERKKKE